MRFPSMKGLFVAFILFLSLSAIFAKKAKKEKDGDDDDDTKKSEKDHSYTSYQRTLRCNPKSEIQHPRKVEDLVAIVKKAVESESTVKAIGSRHSLTDIICTEGTPISMEHFIEMDLNADGTAKFGAGTELQDALTFLEEKNLSLIHVPTFGGLSLGGLIGTGSHGSSLRHPATFSDQIVSLKVIDGMGEDKEIKDPEDLAAFKTHLGLLGIVYEITISTVPLFKVKVKNTVESDSILLDGKASQIAEDHDWAQFFWFPSTASVVVLKGDHVSMKRSKNAISHMIPDFTSEVITAEHNSYEIKQGYKDYMGLAAVERNAAAALHSLVPGRPPFYSEDGKTMANPAEGIGWRLQSAMCSDKCPWDNGNFSIVPEEFSLAVSLDKLPEAIKETKRILERLPAYFVLFGILIRFSKASDSLLGIAAGKQIATIEWAVPARRNYYEDPKYALGSFQAVQQSLMKKFKGRPHWGKNGLMHFNKESLSSIKPGLKKFKEIMDKYDPKKVFWNKFAERVFGDGDTDDVTAFDPSIKHCALQDYCKCKEDKDCGQHQKCWNFEKEISVCRDGVDLLGDNFRIPPYNPHLAHHNHNRPPNLLGGLLGK